MINVTDLAIDSWECLKSRMKFLCFRQSSMKYNDLHLNTPFHVWISPNKALQPTAAAVLVCQGHKSHPAAAAAELGR
jgi:hypothetical protein